MLEKNTDWSMVKCENGIVNLVENFIMVGGCTYLKANVCPVY